MKKTIQQSVQRRDTPDPEVKALGAFLEDQLYDFADGLLADPLKEDVQALIAADPQAQSFIDDYQKAKTTVSIDDSPDAEQKVLAILRDSEVTATNPRPKSSRRKTGPGAPSKASSSSADPNAAIEALREEISRLRSDFALLTLTFHKSHDTCRDFISQGSSHHESDVVKNWIGFCNNVAKLLHFRSQRRFHFEVAAYAIVGQDSVIRIAGNEMSATESRGRILDSGPRKIGDDELMRQLRDQQLPFIASGGRAVVPIRGLREDHPDQYHLAGFVSATYLLGDHSPDELPDANQLPETDRHMLWGLADSMYNVLTEVHATNRPEIEVRTGASRFAVELGKEYSMQSRGEVRSIGSN